MVTTRALHLCIPARAHDQYILLPDTLFFVNEYSPTFNFREPLNPVMNLTNSAKRTKNLLVEKVESLKIKFNLQLKVKKVVTERKFFSFSFWLNILSSNKFHILLNSVQSFSCSKPALQRVSFVILMGRDVMSVKQERFKNFTALRLESSFAIVRSSAAAAPVSSIFVNGASEVKDSLVHHLSVTAFNQLGIQVNCNEIKTRFVR